MARWVLNRPGVWEYPPLGFRAADGAVLIADTRPDTYWTLGPDQAAAETVVRHVLGSLDPFDGGIPAQHAIRDHLDGGTPTTNGNNINDMDGGAA